ncbi:MAG TPA: hypothetical protein VFV00_19710 [Acidimicrobiales bacterium]|nr:hypothetical protein [Acidimicrobiales bacterium]
MEERPERVEQFKEEIASMRLRDPATARDRQLFWFGVGLMIIGVLLGVYAYALSHGTTNALQQRDAIVIALIGVTVAVVGAALFVRYSIAQFLRFWLARLSYEQQASTDRVVEAITREK